MDDRSTASGTRRYANGGDSFIDKNIDSFFYPGNTCFYPPSEATPDDNAFAIDFFDGIVFNAISEGRKGESTI